MEFLLEQVWIFLVKEYVISGLMLSYLIIRVLGCGLHEAFKIETPSKIKRERLLINPGLYS